MNKTSVILLTATLILFCENINARATLSSYEKSLNTSKEKTATVQTLNTKDLSRKLKATGWHVTEAENGNLIINRSDTNPSNISSIYGADKWQEIEQQLQQTGWITRRDPDGSLILVPPPPHLPEAAEVKNEQIAKANNFQDLQRKLREAGWKVSNTTDGNILLYPPTATSFDKPTACPGIPQTAGVSVPVNTWQKAHQIAVAWLHQQPGYHAMVGKIRKVLNIYIISIVNNQMPHKLIQQIAIRNTDGAIIVLN